MNESNSLIHKRLTFKYFMKPLLKQFLRIACAVHKTDFLYKKKLSMLNGVTELISITWQNQKLKRLYRFYAILRSNTRVGNLIFTQVYILSTLVWYHYCLQRICLLTEMCFSILHRTWLRLFYILRNKSKHELYALNLLKITLLLQNF